MRNFPRATVSLLLCLDFFATCSASRFNFRLQHANSTKLDNSLETSNQPLTFPENREHPISFLRHRFNRHCSTNFTLSHFFSVLTNQQPGPIKRSVCYYGITDIECPFWCFWRFYAFLPLYLPLFLSFSIMAGPDEHREKPSPCIQC